MHKTEISLMHDLLFKETFANIANRKQLERLIELLLDYPEGYLRDKLTVQNESSLPEEQEKLCNNIIVKFDDTLIDIEAHINFNISYLKKSIYYFKKIQDNKLKKGNNNIKKIIQIILVKNSEIDLGDEPIMNFQICCDENPNLKLLEDEFLIKIIQVDKVNDQYPNSSLEKWQSFNKTNNSDKRKEEEERLIELINLIKKYVNDEETQEKLNKWDIQIATEKSYEEGKEKGMAEGLEQGIKQGIEKNQNEIIKNMLKKGLSDKDISEFTGLPLKEINKIKGE